MITVVIQI